MEDSHKKKENKINDCRLSVSTQKALRYVIDLVVYLVTKLCLKSDLYAIR